ncbi:MAG: ferredoxin--NADP reductase [Phycisphaerales bacterium]|nr:ferredoxin--NADP reductase [Phycisphaerales bacterium]
MKHSELNAIVIQKIDLAWGLMVLRVATDGSDLPAFTPGQFVVLGLPGSASRCCGSDPDETRIAPDKLIRRAYSISSASVAREYMEFYISLVQSGELTPRLFDLKIGDHLWLGPKASGLFTLDSVPRDSNTILFSTGTGLAPYVSMVRSFLTHEPHRRLAIIHGARHSWDLGYHAELTSLQHISPDFAYIPVVSRPNEEPVPWTGRTGHVQSIWEQRALDDLWGFHPDLENTHVFVCGNPTMVDQTAEILKTEGYAEHSRKSPGNLHIERYW